MKTTPRLHRSSYQASLVMVTLLLLTGLSPSTAVANDPRIIEADVCVYGGTSGGVVAAVQASRMGKRVVIAEPGRHLGGMTAGGLSAVDIGNPRSVGGIAREYFTRLVKAYGKTLVWDAPADGKRLPATGGAFAIEPHAAERLFVAMAEEAKVPVHFRARLKTVTKQGARIRELLTEDGTIFRARVFIDTTYEGDLMAKAGVSYTLTREGNAKYGETYNGIHYAEAFRPRWNHAKPGPNGRTPSGQGVWDRDFPLDPYVVPGDPKSGLLPLIQAGEPGKPGDPAPGIQAYCFRLCLTTAANRLPIAPPPNYDPKRYELVARFIAACERIGDDMDLRWFAKYDPLPNDKWDFNTATIGANLPGASWEWPEASYDRREQIAKEHENYQRGLLHFLATDPRVPVKVRDEVKRFGLPRDEFVDNGGWPHQIYVREARRMVSDLVMTEHHTFGRQVAPAAVSLGSYGTDTHEIRRIVKDGVVIREGKTATGRGGAPPYPIGYGAIVPKAAECDNLFVTFALSASHTAFSSIRMEPVFMATSQSAATAACLAIDADVPVQQVDYQVLRKRLEADGQVLSWPPAKADTPASGPKEQKPALDPKEQKPALGPKATTDPKTPREPVQLAPAAKPADVDGKHFDLVVVGGSPGGIACAVRASREGLTVLLTNHTRHVGGMLTNGLFQWDALYAGHRAPIFNEYAKMIEDYYRRTYGKDSPQYKKARFTQTHYPMSAFEPSVAEREFNRLLAAEKNVTLLLGHDPVAVDREGALLRGLTFREYGGTGEVRVRAKVFADCTYEGDLAALAKVPYRVGREARSEYGEPHAGKIYTNIVRATGPQDALEGRLNLHPYGHKQGTIDPNSPFSADKAVQGYNYRLCLSNDPNNLRLPEKPANYNRDEYVNFNRKGMGKAGVINGKGTFNNPILPGENHAYPEADWPTREKIMRRHRDFALGLMYFMQNDPSVPPAQREAYRKIGLPLDEFPDNDNIPYEMYVREARRIVGRYVFKEQDNTLAPGLMRTPIFPDSVAMTDWPMDSHECTTDRKPGFAYEGKLILTEESRPAQVPWRCLLPKEVDNLLVPVCVSATHVAWGAIRLEPVWMQLGESAGVAVALSVKKGIPPARLDSDRLVRELAERRFTVSFFNDFDTAEAKPWVPAVQYLGTKGFFPSYDARPAAPLTATTAKAWVAATAKLLTDRNLDATSVAKTVPATEPADAVGVTAGELVNQLKQALGPPDVEASARKLGLNRDQPITRGEACRLIVAILDDAARP